MIFLLLILFLFSCSISPLGLMLASLFYKTFLNYKQRYSLLTVKFFKTNVTILIISSIIVSILESSINQIFVGIFYFIFYYFLIYKPSLSRVNFDNLWLYLNPNNKNNSPKHSVFQSDDFENTHVRYNEDLDIQTEVQYHFNETPYKNPYHTWHTTNEEIANNFTKFSTKKFLQRELEEILTLNDCSLTNLKKDVYNNRQVFVQDIEQVYLSLFITFGPYQKSWNLFHIEEDNDSLKITINRIENKSNKSSTFILT